MHNNSMRPRTLRQAASAAAAWMRRRCQGVETAPAWRFSTLPCTGAQMDKEVLHPAIDRRCARGDESDGARGATRGSVHRALGACTGLPGGCFGGVAL